MSNLLDSLVKLLPHTPTPALDDVHIRERVIAEIGKRDWAPRCSIDVKVENGVAELTGLVSDGRQRDALRVVAENTPGVKGVREALIWMEPMSGMLIDGPQDDTAA